MSDFLDRLIAEHYEVSVKISKLEEFQKSEAFKKIDPTQMTLLNIQYHAMMTYSQCLLERRLLLEAELTNK